MAFLSFSVGLLKKMLAFSKYVYSFFEQIIQIILRLSVALNRTLKLNSNELSLKILCTPSQKQTEVSEVLDRSRHQHIQGSMTRPRQGDIKCRPDKIRSECTL